MYPSKDILKAAQQQRTTGDLEIAGMLEHLNQLKYSYIPQLLKQMESKGFYWDTDHNFPHMVKHKPCAAHSIEDKEKQNSL
jgi:hypothetical protein